ncbi:response regulator [Pseudomonas sp. 102515]|uniref:response regulator n=1 Tax=Pseudomonas sp. 102515 TaxID=3071568 RepID=UPI0028035632|nr:response regulator [Pseudomonas sp. 102515]MDQ7912344.1 response regulator [Pseudomonas sp. 102515]
MDGVRVLVVEDEGAIAMLIEEMLEDLGCIVVASVAQLAKATDIARSIEVDLAMLDVNLAGQLVFPVAEILRDRNIPFLFSTGYGASGLSSEFAQHPVLHKPFSQKDLEAKITAALVTRAEAAGYSHPEG